MADERGSVGEKFVGKTIADLWWREPVQEDEEIDVEGPVRLDAGVEAMTTDGGVGKASVFKSLR